MNIDRCKSCQAAIVWLPTAQGKYMPTDAATVQDGDHFFDRDKGHQSHFATCPNARQHRVKRIIRHRPGE